MYVLRRNEDGKYAARPGLPHSYTRDLDYVQIFATRAEAEAQRCGNETVVKIGG